MRAARRFLSGAVLALCTVAASALASPPAIRAEGAPRPGDGMPVIAAGREADIVALIRPWRLGQEIVPGWILDGAQINQTDVVFRFTHASAAARTLTLAFPGRVPAATEHSASFALIRHPGDGPHPDPDPLDAFAATVKANDAGSFWPASGPSDPVASTRSADGSDLRPAREPLDWRRLQREIAGDGLFLLFAALVFVLAHLRRQLREDPAWVAPALLGVVVLGGVLRMVLSPTTLMEAWPYERLAPLAARVYHGPLLQWLNTVAGGRLFLSDVLFATNYVVAALTPLVLYAHARYILRDHGAALAAAALLAVVPEHLRFARSDVYMIQSLATSSLTFVVLYTALLDRSRAWRAAGFLLLPALCAATYVVRPENLIFVVLDLGAIYICMRAAGGITAGAMLAIFIVSGTALLAFLLNILTHYSGSVAHGLSAQTLINAVRIAFDVHLNTLINPWITPPGLGLLAVLGGIALWRRGEQPRALFLVAWLVGFFVVHSFVVPSHAAMQARYHMNLVTPLILLAAAATPVVLTWRPIARLVVVTYLALSPLLHRDFIRDEAFNEMREFAFIRALRDRIPPGCTVIEYSGLPGAGQGRQFASRIGRISAHLAGGRPSDYWTIVPAAALEGGVPFTPENEILSPDAAAVLANPPACLVFYEGLTCASLRRDYQVRAPICQMLHDRLALQPLATTTFPSRIYDAVNAGYLEQDTAGHTYSHLALPNHTAVTLTAFRARPAGAPGAPPPRH